MPKKVLLSTDIGSDVDDSLALLAILNSKDIDLKGVYTVNGNVMARACIAKHMMNLSKRGIDVVVGESSPLEGMDPYSHYEDHLVDYSFVDEENLGKELIFKDPKETGIRLGGAEEMARRLKEEEYSIFSIAPMTGIAKLIMDHKEVLSNITKIYIMGFNLGDADSSEHNLAHDTKAAEIVLNSGIPLQIIPSNVCDRYRMPSSLPKFESKVGKYVEYMVKAQLGGHVAEGFREILSNNQELSSILDGCFEIKKSPNNETLILKMTEEMEYSEFAYEEPEEYFERYNLLIKYLNEKKVRLGSVLIDTLSSFLPKSISISDVYVPYCFLNPDKIRVKRANVSCDSKGKSHISEGDKHEVVEGIDIEHFNRFLKEHLR